MARQAARDLDPHPCARPDDRHRGHASSTIDSTTASRASTTGQRRRQRGVGGSRGCRHRLRGRLGYYGRLGGFQRIHFRQQLALSHLQGDRLVGCYIQLSHQAPILPLQLAGMVLATFQRGYHRLQYRSGVCSHRFGPHDARLGWCLGFSVQMHQAVPCFACRWWPVSSPPFSRRRTESVEMPRCAAASATVKPPSSADPCGTVLLHGAYRSARVAGPSRPELLTVGTLSRRREEPYSSTHVGSGNTKHTKPREWGSPSLWVKPRACERAQQPARAPVRSPWRLPVRSIVWLKSVPADRTTFEKGHPDGFHQKVRENQDALARFPIIRMSRRYLIFRPFRVTSTPSEATNHVFESPTPFW